MPRARTEAARICFSGRPAVPASVRALEYAVRAAVPGPVQGIVRRRGSALGLGRLLHRTPSDLSGGEKQRVAVGRALLACPELLLMDEPLTGLDRGKREEIMAYVKAIPERFGVPVLYVTHSDAERRFLADRVLNLEDGKLTEY